MTDPRRSTPSRSPNDSIEDRFARGDLGFLDEKALTAFIVRQRWFGAKSHEMVEASVLDSSLVSANSPLLAIALVDVRLDPGVHEIYQLPIGLRPAQDHAQNVVIAEVDGRQLYDAFSDPALIRELVALMRASATLEGERSTLEFLSPSGPSNEEVSSVRPIGAEQSNSSVVIDNELILKIYRRLEAGVNPDLEVLQFLTEAGFGSIAALRGWYAYSAPAMAATLGILQEFIPDAEEGWHFALDSLAAGDDRFLATVRRLGEVTAELHSVLASDPSDPRFRAEEMTPQAVDLLAATVDEEVAKVFLSLPPREELAPIAKRGEEVRQRLRLLSTMTTAGRVIRTHGDYHLGQVLRTEDDWIVLDFEGEPARTLLGRRRKQSPLRDVAGMLRSFAYAVEAARAEGAEPESGWEDRARSEFLLGYFERVDPTLLPTDQDGTERLLAVFELEKAVYELRYELENRPAWVSLPVTGIVHLLDAPVAASD